MFSLLRPLFWKLIEMGSAVETLSIIAVHENI